MASVFGPANRHPPMLHIIPMLHLRLSLPHSRPVAIFGIGKRKAPPSRQRRGLYLRTGMASNPSKESP